MVVGGFWRRVFLTPGVFPSFEWRERWCRLVSKRHAVLFPQLGDEPVRCGGSLSVVVAHVERVGSGRGFDDDRLVRDTIEAFMDERGLECADAPFLTSLLPICEAFYLETHVPVRVRGAVYEEQ